MYNAILSVKYEDAKSRFKEYLGSDVCKRIIALKNCEEIDSVSNESDIIIYYNLFENSVPMLIVERIKRKRGLMKEVRKVVKCFNKEHDDYIATYEVSKDKKNVDIVVVKGNIYEGLLK